MAAYDASVNVQFYREQGGAVVHLGPTGTFIVETGAKIQPAAGLPTTAALTSAAGTPGTGTVDVGSSFSQTTLNANFATLVTQVNAILTILKNVGLSA